MATARKTKSLKGAGKQHGPAQTAKGEADTSTPSLFQQAMWAARDLWMGAPDGELGKIGELENETWACECSTAEAIRGAEPTKKLSALHCGVDELQEKLYVSATRYYNKCFELALRNRAELDATLSVVATELCRTAPVSNPAEFARAWTTGDLSTFLRVTALDGKEKAQEIGSDGRVREFIRHVCGDYSDVLAVDPDAEQNKVFLLPRWPTGRTVGAKMAQWWLPPANGDESRPLTLEETEHFILGTEEILIKNLRRAIADAHRFALVDQANVVVTLPSKMGAGRNASLSVSVESPNNEGVQSQPSEGKLPKKTSDFGEWMDEADLTERQRTCFSYKMEYGLSVSKIARRLDISRPVVQEHIDTANRKINQARSNQTSARKSAKSGLE